MSEFVKKSEKIPPVPIKIRPYVCVSVEPKLRKLFILYFLYILIGAYRVGFINIFFIFIYLFLYAVFIEQKPHRTGLSH